MVLFELKWVGVKCWWGGCDVRGKRILGDRGITVVTREGTWLIRDMRVVSLCHGDIAAGRLAVRCLTAEEKLNSTSGSSALNYTRI